MPEPDLEKGRGEGGDGLPTKFFRAFGPQFGPKIREGAGPPWDPPLQPSSKLDQTDQVTDHMICSVHCEQGPV